jgi:hypothetical protein
MNPRSLTVCANFCSVINSFLVNTAKEPFGVTHKEKQRIAHYLSTLFASISHVTAAAAVCCR